MSSEALIYKVQDYQESSKLLFVYTKTGKYTLVAKGSKNYKNNFFHLADYLNLITADIDSNKDMQTLKNAKLLNSYEDLKKDYKTIKIASKILNVIDSLIIDVSHEDKIFNLILNLLDYKNLELAYLSLLVKLTYSLGYMLSFSNKEIKGFNLKLGKTVKKEEDLYVDLDLTLTLYLKLIYYSKEEIEVPDEVIYKIFSFIKSYYLYHLDYKIKDL